MRVIHRPGLIDLHRRRQRYPCPGAPFAPTSPDQQSCPSIEPVKALAIPPPALAHHQHMQPPISVPWQLRRQRLHHCDLLGRFAALTLVAHGRAPHPDHCTRPPLAHSELLLHPAHGRASGRGRSYFRWGSPWSAWFSRVSSPPRFLSRRFSSPNCLSRRASETSSPPYFDFHR